MASEAVMVILALIGIGVIVIGVMNLVVMQRPCIEDGIRTDRLQWRGHYYSHLPIRPFM